MGTAFAAWKYRRDGEIEGNGTQKNLSLQTGGTPRPASPAEELTYCSQTVRRILTFA